MRISGPSSFLDGPWNHCSTHHQMFAAPGCSEDPSGNSDILGLGTLLCLKLHWWNVNILCFLFAKYLLQSVNKEDEHFFTLLRGNIGHLGLCLRLLHRRPVLQSSLEFCFRLLQCPESNFNVFLRKMILFKHMVHLKYLSQKTSHWVETFSSLSLQHTCLCPKGSVSLRASPTLSKYKIQK